MLWSCFEIPPRISKSKLWFTQCKCIKFRRWDYYRVIFLPPKYIVVCRAYSCIDRIPYLVGFVRVGTPQLVRASLHRPIRNYLGLCVEMRRQLPKSLINGWLFIVYRDLAERNWWFGKGVFKKMTRDDFTKAVGCRIKLVPYFSVLLHSRNKIATTVVIYPDITD